MTISQLLPIHSQVGRFATRLQYLVLGLVVMTSEPSTSMAQTADSHIQDTQQNPAGRGQQSQANALVKIIRESLDRFKEVKVAMAEGYALQFGCVTGSDSGAMGLHYVNGDLVSSGILDATRPQMVIYEPNPDGSLKLIGVDYLLFADAWNKTHSAPPQLMGQLFHLFEAPNRFGLPAFYTLHVWAWKENPNGAFVNWHPHVSCDSFAGQNR